MEPLDERVESLTARRTSPFDDFVSCNLVLTLPLFDCVFITMKFEVFLSEELVDCKNISASIAPFFDSRNMLLRSPLVGDGGRKKRRDR